MFKIAYRELRSQQFGTAMYKLGTCTEFKNPKVTYNIARTMKILSKELSESQKQWSEIASPLFVTGEDGNFKINETKSFFVCKEGVDENEATKKVDTFLNKEVLVERFKMKLEDLQAAKLSPSDVAALEPLLENVLE